MENNQAKGASKWLTSRRLIDFDPFLSQFLIATVCERESLFFPFFFKLKKNCGWGAEETLKKGKSFTEHIDTAHMQRAYKRTKWGGGDVEHIIYRRTSITTRDFQ